MKIVLDTNILVNRWFLSGPTFDLLEKYLHQTNSVLILPRIVIQEIQNKYREVLNKRIFETSHAIKEVQRLTQHVQTSIQELSIDAELTYDKYEQFLNYKITQLKTQIPEYNDIPHDIIVRRAIASRKPFGAGDRGYRDTLIWETILRKVVTPTDKTIFITNNSKDFCDSNGELHSDLKEDLTLLKLLEHNVEIILSIEKFNNQFVEPTLKKLDDLKTALNENKLPNFSIETWIDSASDQIIGQLNYQINKLLFYYFLDKFDVVDPNITLIDQIIKFEVENVFEVSAEHVIADIYLETELEIEFYLGKNMSYYLDELQVPIHLADANWNESYSLAYAYINVPFRLSLKLNTVDYSVDSFDVSLIEFFGRCSECSQLIFDDAAEICPNCNHPLY